MAHFFVLSPLKQVSKFETQINDTCFLVTQSQFKLGNMVTLGEFIDYCRIVEVLELV